MIVYSTYLFAFVLPFPRLRIIFARVLSCLMGAGGSFIRSIQGKCAFDDPHVRKLKRVALARVVFTRPSPSLLRI
ncbi:hypothetical protein LIPSTDRAFT_234885 [Lipomyces starkeyi NRRL Y-11557]|uniref:Uncharacterized protein n=1 Tax=Lipomyces starkeyi NRRL Y-11557 TaxID=675824 RepID=A0A1E3QBD0_LIPST|nr:hypothetical protein LIPSTDRAFT_234885 [Lipomyces starkeyi NRRL Y-11557]